MSAQAQSGLVALAGIGRARGLAGECIVHPHGATLESLECPCEVRVGAGEAGARAMVLTWVGRIGRDAVCRFQGIGDRTGAESLRAQTIYLDQALLPEPEAGTYYVFELEGMEVRDGAVVIGRVLAIHQYPAASAMEIERPDGRRQSVPMTPGVVRKVDRVARHIDMDMSATEEIQ